MDFNEYVVELDLRARLADARAAAARRAQLPRRRRRHLRVELGALLIALGQRLLEPAPAPAPERTRA